MPSEIPSTLPNGTPLAGSNHFELFGLPVAFGIDGAALDRAYRIVQTQVHPDRFAAAGDAQKRVAMQWATRTNDAYQTLRQPLSRAVYLLELRGVPVRSETGAALEPAFLMEQMEWRERVEDAAAARNIGALEQVLDELGDEQRIRLGKLAVHLDHGADQAAAEAVRQLMFIDSVARDVEKQLDRLDSN
jgi:molecular chaperone HscB